MYLTSNNFDSCMPRAISAATLIHGFSIGLVRIVGSCVVNTHMSAIIGLPVVISRYSSSRNQILTVTATKHFSDLVCTVNRHFSRRTCCGITTAIDRTDTGIRTIIDDDISRGLRIIIDINYFVIIVGSSLHIYRFVWSLVTTAIDSSQFICSLPLLRLILRSSIGIIDRRLIHMYLYFALWRTFEIVTAKDAASLRNCGTVTISLAISGLRECGAVHLYSNITPHIGSLRCTTKRTAINITNCTTRQADGSGFDSRLIRRIHPCTITTGCRSIPVSCVRVGQSTATIDVVGHSAALYIHSNSSRYGSLFTTSIYVIFNRSVSYSHASIA